MEHFKHELSCLVNKELFSGKVEKLILAEKNKRLKDMPVGSRIITIQAGFSGLAGVVAYYIGCDKNYYKFGPRNNGEVRWLLKPDELALNVRFYK
jgi:hypothetical protein